MNAVIRIPSAGGPAPKKGCEGILEAIESVTQSFQKSALSYAQYVGQYLIDLKAEAKREGKSWGELCERLPFSQNVAGKFIKIASNEALQDSAHAQNLPPDTTTLYTIARMPAPEVEKHIKAGRITPTMTRSEASKLVNGKAKPKKASKSKYIPEGAEEAKEERRKALAEAWRKASPFDREWFLEQNRDWFDRRLTGEYKWQ